ncbi:MAG TPA: pyridoxal phosphate-dependent aminotransferase [Terriglobales bacterium]|nr:pyridoxal phosphate-dependent aminotransferase [Terriglobales bacterium]
MPISSRRSFLQATGMAALAMRIVTEPMLAGAREKAYPNGAVIIDQNENPLGPCQTARDAIAAIAPQGGRYSLSLTDDLIVAFARTEGLRPEYVAVFPGSSPALHHSVLCFTSRERSYVTANPGYEAGLYAADHAGARTVNVPLTKDYAHDVRAMLDAAPDGGLFYICTPNNPTGTLTSHSDIEYLVDHKPKDSIVLVDEAYIHFADATSAIDMVKADKDVIVLRTFSKIYGMAGLRCGVAIARPDLLEKIQDYNGWSAMPVTAVAAGMASLKDSQLVSERKRINSRVRAQTFEWLRSHGYSFIPSQSNFFMLDAKRPGKEAIDAMAAQDVFIGRIWPIMPTWVRITVGTQEEMERFQIAWKRVMDATAVGKLPQKRAVGRLQFDGTVIPT